MFYILFIFRFFVELCVHVSLRIWFGSFVILCIENRSILIVRNTWIWIIVVITVCIRGVVVIWLSRLECICGY